ncbi:GNAT family N-acetyltransferase [Muricoccus radiodurans]|uniref:GNAT family N-acetyltransferase n=1 Tax=Muricoccus radiodurans TaxID=2231721 RepID=UPI003CE754EE
MTPIHPYASAAYATTLRHVGRPVWIDAWGTHVLLRDVPGSPGMVDAAGLYPLCAMRPDADLAGGLQALRELWAVSVVLVADPLAGPDAQTLAAQFPLCRAFKTHQLVNRAAPVVFSAHHRERVRRGGRRARVEQVVLREPRWRAAWEVLYAGLVARHGITGAAAFPPAAFAALAGLPEGALRSFAALSPDGEVLAMQLWVRHGDAAYSHLTATSEAGYRALATYALYAAAIEDLSDARVLDLGGGAGHADDAEDGLTRFKGGFANAAVTAHLCGAVLDPASYARLGGHAETGFFPAYRDPARGRAIPAPA